MDNPSIVKAPPVETRELDDFDIASGPAPLSELMGLPDSVVTVRRRSTGDERIYPNDPDWVDSMFNDLAEGRFGE